MPQKFVAENQRKQPNTTPVSSKLETIMSSTLRTHKHNYTAFACHSLHLSIFFYKELHVTLLVPKG